MIEYELKDIDDNTYPLNGDTVTVALKNTWTQGADTFEYENKVIERSFLPGATVVAPPRVMSRQLNLTVESTNADPASFRAEVNALLSFVAKTRYIVDITNDMQIEVVPASSAIEYANGSLKLNSVNAFEFTVLTPYWAAMTEVEYTGTILADTLTAVSLTNAGFFPVPPVITLVTTALTNSVSIYVDSSDEGIQVDDAIFGTVGNLTMIIDNLEGLVSIGLLNENAEITEGTGFFEIPEGAQDVYFLCADEDVDYTIAFFPRFYL